MSSKIQKKRSNSDQTADQSPPKKQKKQTGKKPPPPNAVESNGDGAAAPQTLTASQRKRLNSKNRKLAAIARIKEEGGIPKPLWAGKKDKKSKEGGANNGSVESKLKVKQDERVEKKKLRQEKRQQDGQYKVEQVKLTADEIRLRITEIKGRGDLTKTAKRKLGVLIKKLAIEEGTAIVKEVANKTGKENEDEDTKNLSKSEKRRVRREKQGSTGVKKGEADSEDGADDPSEEKPVNIQVFEKKKPKLAALKKGGKGNGDVGVKVAEDKFGGKKNKKQIVEVKKIEGEIEGAESGEEEEDEEEDESEGEVTGMEIKGEEEVEEEDSDDDEEDELNSSNKEAEEEEEDDDDDDDEEDVEEDLGTPKVRVINKTVKKKEESKGKKEPSQQLEKKLDQDQNSDKKKRYILFVGNLPFESKQEDIKQHFLTKVGKVSSVRIPTKPGTQIPRGFGYVEVTNDVDYEKGLSLHHTFLNGRRINVEYTLAGSKQVGKRQELVSKNQKLHALRKAGKLAGSQKHDQKRSVRRFKKREQERQPKQS